MTPTQEFLSALFGADDTTPIPLYNTDGFGTAYDTVLEGALYTSPNTENGVAFVFKVLENETPSVADSATFKPTAVLFKDGTVILCWAFDMFEKVERVRALANALGCDVEDMIPCPGTNGWEVSYIDPNVFHNLDVMSEALVIDEPLEDEGFEIDPEIKQDLTEAMAEVEAHQAGGIELESRTVEPVMYGDAKVLRPYDDSLPQYHTPIIVTLGARTDSKNWKPETMPLGQFIASLCQHKVGKKDGPAWVGGDMVPGQRLKNSVKAIYVIGLDIDTGTPSAVVDAALMESGCTAVRYTTHSHNKFITEFKKDKWAKWLADEKIDTDEITDELIQKFLLENQQWDPSVVQTATYAGTDHTEKGIIICVEHMKMPKHRIVIPLAVPFEVANEGKSQREATDKWAKIPAAISAKLGLPFDKSCVDPSRLFYFPRHDSKRGFEISLFGGPLFDWRTLELDNAFDTFVTNMDKGKSKSVTEEGRALGRWSITHATGFQIVDVIEAYAPDRLRGTASQGYAIECAFDEEHSNSGERDDVACFVVNAGMGSSEIFTASCRHESCRNKTALDMLGKMIKDGWFDKSVLEDESFMATVVEGSTKPDALKDPVVEKIKKEDGARAIYLEAIEALSPSATSHEINEAIKVTLDANLDDIQMDMARSLLKKKTGVTIATVRKAFDRVKKKEMGKSAKETGKLVIPPSPTPFELPPDYMGDFSLIQEGGTIWIAEGGVRLFTLLHIAAGATYPDRKGARGLRVEVLNNHGQWVIKDVPAGLLAHVSGNEVIEIMLDAGVSFAHHGRQRLLEILLESRPTGPVVYHRPGMRDGSFLIATGEVVIAAGPVELAPEVRIGVNVKAGDIESFKNGARDLFSYDEAAPHQAAFLSGLAGPLCNIAGDAPLVYFLAGATTLGKTTAQAVAVAHFCAPKIDQNGLFARCNATKNSLEVYMERASGAVFALDELSMMPASELSAFAYMIEGQSGKKRLDQRGNARPSRGWGGCSILLSGESSVGQRLVEEGAVQHGGLSARIMILPFEKANKLDTDKFAAVETILHNFGWSGAEFIRYLKKAGLADNPALINARLGALIDRLPYTQGTENLQKRRAARMVGYLWLAGEIAKEAGILPANINLEPLILRLWTDSLASDVAPNDPADKAVENVLNWIIANRGGAIRDWAKKDEGFKEATGWFDFDVPANASNYAGSAYVIRADQLTVIGGKAANYKAVLKALEEKNLLVRKDDKSRTWSGIPGLSKNGQFVVLKASEIDG